MPGYNKNFEFSVNDMELIEDALREKKRELSDQAHTPDDEFSDGVSLCLETAQQVRSIFFRPSSETYIGG